MASDLKTERDKACSSAICKMANDIIEEAQKEPVTKKEPVSTVTFEGHGIFSKDIVERYTVKERKDIEIEER